jgi:hypothetical protein
MPDAIAIVNEYLAAFYSGDFARARGLVADEFQFKGPFVEAANRDAFFDSAARLAPIVRGHEVRHQWSDGRDVCTIFDMRLGGGSVTTCEWHTVGGSLLVQARVILDTNAFRALMPAR